MEFPRILSVIVTATVNTDHKLIHPFARRVSEFFKSSKLDLNMCVSSGRSLCLPHERHSLSVCRTGSCHCLNITHAVNSDGSVFATDWMLLKDKHGNWIHLSYFSQNLLHYLTQNRCATNLCWMEKKITE